MADRDSESEASTSSSSEDSVMVARPVFVKRKPPAASSDTRVSVLERAEFMHGSSLDVQDVDDEDPEAEYRAWQLREKARLRRDRAVLDEIESAKDAAAREKMAR